MQKVNFKRVRSFVETGLVAELAPEVLKGFLIDFFESNNINTAEATEWIEGNKSLWGSLKPEQQAQMKRMAQKAGNLDFVNANWAINALRKDLPLLASLFLGWTKAHNWLERQLSEIKEEIKHKT